MKILQLGISIFFETCGQRERERERERELSFAKKFPRWTEKKVDVPLLTCWGGDDRCFATYTWHGCTRLGVEGEDGEGIERDNPFTCAAFVATWSGAFFHNFRKCRPSTARLTPRVVSALSSTPKRLFSPRDENRTNQGVKGDRRDRCCQQFYATSVVKSATLVTSASFRRLLVQFAVARETFCYCDNRLQIFIYLF